VFKYRSAKNVLSILQDERGQSNAAKVREIAALALRSSAEDSGTWPPEVILAVEDVYRPFARVLGKRPLAGLLSTHRRVLVGRTYWNIRADGYIAPYALLEWPLQCFIVGIGPLYWLIPPERIGSGKRS
jgi:hypothetical protein